MPIVMAARSEVRRMSLEGRQGTLGEGKLHARYALGAVELLP